VSKKIDSFSWSFGGKMDLYKSLYTSEIELCEMKHSTDYKIVSYWISKM